MRRLGVVVVLLVLASACIGTEIGEAPVPGAVDFVANGQSSYGIAMRHPSDNDAVRDALLDAMRCTITDSRGGVTEEDATQIRSLTTVNNTSRWHEWTPSEGQVSVACQFVPETSLSQRWVDDEAHRTTMVILESDAE